MMHVSIFVLKLSTSTKTRPHPLQREVIKEGEKKVMFVFVCQ
jgi:hypothetical protein